VPDQNASDSPYTDVNYSDKVNGMRSLRLLIGIGPIAAVAGLILVKSITGSTPAEVVEATQMPLPVLATTLFSADDIEPTQTLDHASGTLKSKQTLVGLVTDLGADHADANTALAALYENELIDPRRLRPGLQADIWMKDGALQALAVKADADSRLMVSRSTLGTWTPSQLNVRLTPSMKRIEAEISTSIYDQARNLGASDQQVVDFASVFAYDVDFQREIHPGDRFEIVYETFVDERGTPIRSGDVVYASLNGKAITRGFYKFTPSDDPETDYFDQNGESATKFLMKTPINGARLSSSFGRRRHPISGYTRLHKGTDFAAPRGTPVYAAGHGTVERASRYGGYGKYVRIRHANGYKTAYAHLSRYGNVKKGRRVRQGDVIGYVGSTGASTGPHLHYEVYIKGKPVNAMRLKLPTGRKLAETPEIFDAFLAHKRSIDQTRVNLGAEIEVASVENMTTNTP
jgi:murein DD-endopeptidase MepM/ murein hydrolase activator NlpD